MFEVVDIVQTVQSVEALEVVEAFDMIETDKLIEAVQPVEAVELYLICLSSELFCLLEPGLKHFETNSPGHRVLFGIW